MQVFFLFVYLFIKVFSKFAEYNFVVNLWSWLVQFKMTIALNTYLLFFFFFKCQIILLLIYDVQHDK